MTETPTEERLRLAGAAKAASVVWADAGMKRRLAVLLDAGRHIDRERLMDAYQQIGLSRRLARHLTETGGIPYHFEPRRLQRAARQLIQSIPCTDGSTDVLVRRPDGVVLLIAPSMFPHIATMPLVHMLLPGNSVILRAARHGDRYQPDPVTGYVVQVIRASLDSHGLPQDVLTVVPGSSREILGQLLPSPSVDTVIFFGGYASGTSVAEDAARLGKKAVLELEGSDSFLVWTGADIVRAAESACSAFFFSTQACVAPKRILVHERSFEDFLAAYQARVPAYSSTVEADPENGYLIPVGKISGFAPAFEELRAVGQVVTGGDRRDAQGRSDAEGKYVAPTIVALDAVDVSHKLRSFSQETMFPLIPVVRFCGSDATIMRDMVDMVTRIPFGLRLSVWGEDPAALGFFARHLSGCGLLTFNEHHLGAPEFGATSGGPKRTGGPWGESSYFWEKTSRRQTIRCCGLPPAALASVLESLGALSQGERSDLDGPDGII